MRRAPLAKGRALSQSWPSDMFERVEWLESQPIACGAEASWRDGALRCRLDLVQYEPSEGSWLSKLLGRRPQPAGWSIAARIVTPTHPEWFWRVDTRRYSFPVRSEPLFRAESLLAPRRGFMFELLELLEGGSGVRVRAGSVEAPPDARAHGKLETLDPAARRFASWWLESAGESRWLNEREGAFGHPAIPGFGLRLSPMSTGSLETTFHREQNGGEHFFVRTYGGCLYPREAWYGPFVERAGTYVLAR